MLLDCFLLSEENNLMQGKIFATFESMEAYVKNNNGTLVKGTK